MERADRSHRSFRVDRYADERRRGDPRPISAGLDQVARALHVPSADSFMVLFRQWDTIVGAAAAQHSQPLELVEGRLTVRVDHPAWVTALRSQQATLLSRLGERVGPDVVRELAFFTGRPGRNSAQGGR